jgi:hypothetical protein
MASFVVYCIVESGLKTGTGQQPVASGQPLEILKLRLYRPGPGRKKQRY